MMHTKKYAIMGHKRKLKWTETVPEALRLLDLLDKAPLILSFTEMYLTEYM